MDLTELVPSVEQRIVALEVGKDGAAHLFRRSAADVVESFTLPFRPYILLCDPVLLNGYPGHFEIELLSGNRDFRAVATFDSPKDYDDAKKFLRSCTGFTAGSPNAPYIATSDLVQQALIRSQIRLFSGMRFDEVRRMQIDIETLCEPGYDFSNSARPGDAICIIGMSDNTGWECALSIQNMTEQELLAEFVRIVQERDPDIIEGHNLFRFDLPYIEARAKRWKVKLALGRDGSAPAKRSSRFNIAERTVNYTRYDIFGRHIADTYHLALFYDAIRRDLDGYGLKTIAKHFGVAAENRTYLHLDEEGVTMNEQWAEDPARCMAYCLDDVRETRAIAEILAPASFYQTQIIPLSYQNCIIRGNATRIDSVFLAEYLNEHHSVPSPEPARPFSGALTQSFGEGVYKDVMHCDVRSLYPSILLAGKRGPSRDDLGVFLRYLDTLRTFRLKMKDAAKAATDKAEKDYADSMQATFKILINSFYGYLGFAQGFLNDYDLAETVTTRGREILTLMLDFLTENGANPVEMDTDGIYFQTAADRMALSRKLAERLPEGISVDFDNEYKAMFAYKSKNYALLHQDGSVTLAGAALKSRGLEPFQRDYIRNTIHALLADDPEEYRKIDQACEQALREHSYPLAMLAKSETLSDSLDTYTRKMASGSGRRSAAYELAVRSGKEYRAGDQVTFYITGSKKNVAVVDAAKLLSDGDNNVRDENVPYYLAKLDELRKKFEPFTAKWTKTDPDQMELF